MWAPENPNNNPGYIAPYLQPSVSPPRQPTVPHYPSTPYSSNLSNVQPSPLHEQEIAPLPPQMAPLPPLTPPAPAPTPAPVAYLPANVASSLVQTTPGVCCSECGFGKWQQGVPCIRCRSTSQVAIAQCKYCATKNSFPSRAIMFTCFICHMVSDISTDRVDEDALHVLVSQGHFPRLDTVEALFDIQVQHASNSNSHLPSTITYGQVAEELASGKHLEIINMATLRTFVDLARDPTTGLSKLEATIYRVFSSPKSLSHSFTLPTTLPYCPATIRDSGLDFEAIRAFYRLVLALPAKIRITLFTAIGDLLQRPLLFHEPEQVRIFLILLENPMFLRLHESRDNIARLCSRMASLPNWQAQFLINWLCCPAYQKKPHIFWAMINLLNSFLALRIDNILSSRGTIQSDWTVVSATKAIGILHSANEFAKIVKYVEFRNRKVNESIDIENEFHSWPNQAVFSFCSYPFLLNLATKNSIMKLENQEIQNAMFAESIRDLSSGRVTIPYLTLRVRREYLIDDTLNQLAGKTRELKKQLKIQFAGEEGVDAGGVQKEFFQLIVRQIFDPNYGMFTYNEETRLFWFNSNSLENAGEFELIGTVIGLAIYNGIILDLRFPRVVYRKLLLQKLVLSDVIDVKQDVAKGLQQLLDYTGDDVEDVFCLTFSVSEEVFGQITSRPLKEGGEDIPVTQENKQEYVDLYVRYLLEDSIKAQFTAFQHGFMKVCGGNALKLIHPDELELLICGDSDEVDFADLEHATAYQYYSKDNPTIRNFWAVVHEMSNDNKRKFLTFATGSDRVPYKGVSHLALVITKDGGDSERLPTAHTCFNQIMLPEYRTKAKLQAKLLLAINNCEGFQLK